MQPFNVSLATGFRTAISADFGVAGEGVKGALAAPLLSQSSLNG
jgi:hypothetical protein